MIKSNSKIKNTSVIWGSETLRGSPLIIQGGDGDPLKQF